MIKYEIKIELGVHIDISEITNYIFNETFDNLLASKIYDLLYTKIYSLEIFPNKYKKFYKDFRILITNKFKIFYTVCDRKKIVKIYRVLSNTIKLRK